MGRLRAEVARWAVTFGYASGIAEPVGQSSLNRPANGAAGAGMLLKLAPARVVQQDGRYQIVGIGAPSCRLVSNIRRAHSHITGNRYRKHPADAR